MKQDDVIVVGAGIIGVSVALALQARGRKVRILDRAGICAEASQRNAGAFAFTEIMPLASPGIMFKAPKWLLDPLGPLSIPLAYALSILPWMVRFWRASLPDRHKASIDAQHKLMELSRTALENQIVEVGGEPLMQREGELQLFEGKRQFANANRALAARDRYNVAYSIIEGSDAIAEIQPGLSERFTHAIFSDSWMNTVNPQRWTELLAQTFVQRGGIFERANVKAVRPLDDRIIVETDTGSRDVNNVVVAAGAWSNAIANTIGESFPLETERGYNTTLPRGAFDLRTQLTFGPHGFVISKIDGGVRVGGAVELGGLKLPPKFERADALLAKAATFLPGLNTDDGEQWMGFRPSMPDSLPVVGTSNCSKRIVYAFGHGHLGLTQSAGTAQLVAEIVIGAKSSIPLKPYAPGRF